MNERLSDCLTPQLPSPTSVSQSQRESESVCALSTLYTLACLLASTCSSFTTFITNCTFFLFLSFSSPATGITTCALSVSDYALPLSVAPLRLFIHSSSSSSTYSKLISFFSFSFFIFHHHHHHHPLQCPSPRLWATLTSSCAPGRPSTSPV